MQSRRTGRGRVGGRRSPFWRARWAGRLPGQLWLWLDEDKRQGEGSAHAAMMASGRPVPRTATSKRSSSILVRSNWAAAALLDRHAAAQSAATWVWSCRGLNKVGRGPRREKCVIPTRHPLEPADLPPTLASARPLPRRLCNIRLLFWTLCLVDARSVIRLQRTILSTSHLCSPLTPKTVVG